MENEKKKPVFSGMWSFIYSIFQNNKDIDSTLLLITFTSSFCWFIHICAHNTVFATTGMSKDILDMYFLSFPLLIAYFFKKDGENGVTDNGHREALSKRTGILGFLSNIFRNNKDLDSTMLLLSFTTSFAWFMGICDIKSDFAATEIAAKITKMYSINLALLIAYFFRKAPAETHKETEGG